MRVPGAPGSTSRRALALGLVAIAAYAALAAWSGALSPLARRPMLDGIGPNAPYRWVAPPPDLASTNQPPEGGTFAVKLTHTGSEPGVFFTGDAQVTLVLDADAFVPQGDDRTVRLDVEPLDPADFADPASGLTAFGNVVRIRASYQPSGTEVSRLDRSMSVLLVYPVTPTFHALSHGIQLSTNDGDRWAPLQSNDSLATQQVEARTQRLGLIVVAGEPVPFTASPSSTGGGGGSSTLAILLGGLAVIAAAVGIALILRNRSSH